MLPFSKRPYKSSIIVYWCYQPFIADYKTNMTPGLKFFSAPHYTPTISRHQAVQFVRTTRLMTPIAIVLPDPKKKTYRYGMEWKEKYTNAEIVLENETA
uniref:Transposase n=1 Tax=Heterorhabditis bacteriophora TaxID=37862 RepID=A0A1I7XKE3_HETBA